MCELATLSLNPLQPYRAYPSAVENQSHLKPCCNWSLFAVQLRYRSGPVCQWKSTISTHHLRFWSIGLSCFLFSGLIWFVGLGSDVSSRFSICSPVYFVSVGCQHVLGDLGFLSLLTGICLGASGWPVSVMGIPEPRGQHTAAILSSGFIYFFNSLSFVVLPLFLGFQFRVL